MTASFTLALDTTPPEVGLVRMERSSTEVAVYYTLTEPGDAIAQLDVDGSDTVVDFVDHGDHVRGLVPWNMGGLLTIRGRDIVWNEDSRSFHLNPLTPPSTTTIGGEGEIKEARRGRGHIGDSREGRVR